MNWLVYGIRHTVSIQIRNLGCSDRSKVDETITSSPTTTFSQGTNFSISRKLSEKFYRKLLGKITSTIDRFPLLAFFRSIFAENCRKSRNLVFLIFNEKFNSSQDFYPIWPKIGIIHLCTS